MRLFVLTQEDAFYIPRVLDHLVEARKDVVGVGIVPGEMRLRHLGRYIRLMGLRDFALQSARLVAYRLLDLILPATVSGRSFSVQGSARRHRVALRTVPDVNAATFLAYLRDAGVDLVVSIACPQIFGTRLLQLPKHGCINLHGSMLPRFRGILPSFWSMALGESETGVTVHYMAASVDDGDIIVQERVPIRADDTVHSLVVRSKVEVGRRLLVTAVDMIDRGIAPRIRVDPTGASYFSYPDRTAIKRFRAGRRRFI